MMSLSHSGGHFHEIDHVEDMTPSDQMVQLVLRVHGYCIGALSLLLNSLLLSIIFFKRQTHLGSYRLLIVLSSVANVVYSISLILTNPHIHAEDGIFLLMAESTFNRLIQTVALLFFWITSPALMLIYTVQFLNRYAIICKKLARLKRAIAFQLLVCLAILAVFTWITVEFMWPNDEIEVDVADHMLLELGIYIHNTTYIGFNLMEDPEHWDHNIVFFLLWLLAIFLLSIFTMFFCGISIYRHLNKTFLPKKTREYHYQLVRALVVQALLPIFFNIVPIAVTIFLPVTGAHLTDFFNFIMLAFAWFPLLSAAVNLFLITEYRRTLLLFFKKGPGGSIMSIAATSSPRSSNNISRLAWE